MRGEVLFEKMTGISDEFIAEAALVAPVGVIEIANNDRSREDGTTAEEFTSLEDAKQFLEEEKLIDTDLTEFESLEQAREHLIRKTFEAIEGAKNVIIHFKEVFPPIWKVQSKRSAGRNRDEEEISKIDQYAAECCAVFTAATRGDSSYACCRRNQRGHGLLKTGHRFLAAV